MKIHNVFHSNFLQKLSTDLLTDQVNQLLPLVIIKNEHIQEVEDIPHAKSYQGKI